MMFRKFFIVATVVTSMGHAGGFVRSSFAQQTITLQQAYRLAVAQNPTIELQQARVDEAYAQRRAAWSAIKPQAALQGSFTHYDREVVFNFGGLSLPGLPSSGDLVMQKQNQFAFGITATLPLLNVPAYLRISAARTLAEQAETIFVRNQKDFLLVVAQAYYDLLLQKSAVDAIEKKIAVDQKGVSAARARFEVGKTPRSDLMRAELVLTQDEQILTQQRYQMIAAQRKLGIMLGQKAEVLVVEPAAPVAADASGSVDNILKGRADYHAAQLAIKAARRQSQAALWSFFPTLDVSWGYRWSESTGFAGEKDSWNIMFTATLPVYDGGQRYAQWRSAQAQTRQAHAQKRILAEQVQIDIARLQTEFETAKAAVVSAQKAFALAQTTAADMTASYEVGAVTQLDVLDASQRLLEAELTITRSRYQRDLAALSLNHCLGKF